MHLISPETLARLEAVLAELPAPLATAMLAGLARPHGTYPRDIDDLMQQLQRPDSPVGIRDAWARTTARPCCADDSRDSVAIWTYDDASSRRRRDFAVEHGWPPIRPISLACHNPHGGRVDFALATLDVEDAKQVVNRLCVAISSATEQAEWL